MRRLYVPLTHDELERLSKDAQVNRRRPQDHAAVLLARALTSTPQNVSDMKQEGDRHASEPKRAA